MEERTEILWNAFLQYVDAFFTGKQVLLFQAVLWKLYYLTYISSYWIKFVANVKPCLQFEQIFSYFAKKMEKWSHNKKK